jgi:mannonate dehydratase
MRIDHGRLMLDDADKGYNPGYSFHGRMLALAQIDGAMAAVKLLKTIYPVTIN